MVKGNHYIAVVVTSPLCVAKSREAKIKKGERRTNYWTNLSLEKEEEKSFLSV